MRFALIAQQATSTNNGIAAVTAPGFRWELMTPETALDELGPRDVALGRLDVLPTLDGMDDGLWALGALAARGVLVLNGPPALLGAHDKLLTARLLRRAGIPHPRTWHLRAGRPAPVPKLPVVVKPRFGSWGSAVRRCDDHGDLEDALEATRDATWFKRHGALVQELVPPTGYDLRIVVADGRVVGAVFRLAAPGEWRTNIALGGMRRSAAPPPRDACTIAVAAADAIGASLVGVDLLPHEGSWTVLELNGAVELTLEYAPWGDVFSDIAFALARAALGRLPTGASLAVDIA